MRSRTLALVTLTLAVSVLSVLSGCATVPTQGPLHMERLGSSQPGPTPPVGVLVDGPASGDSALQVARGFIDAMATYQTGQLIARKYLSPAVRERWQPTKVLVYDSGAVPLSEPTPGKVLIDVPQVSEVGANGSWSPTPNKKLALDLGMTKVNGEWRISKPPNALIMSAFNFGREYTEYNLYFFDPDFEILVPDPVYLPIRGHTVTLLVNALLRGPSAWLRPAVRSAFPDGARLEAPSVTVEGQTATVDLDRKVLRLYDSQRRFLLAQLSWTLRQVPSVSRVVATVERVPLMAGESSAADVEQWSTYDPAVAGAARGAYALSGGRVVVIGPDRMVPVSGVSAAGRLRARSLAVSVHGERSSGQPLGRDDGGSVNWLATVSADGHEATVHGAAGQAPRTVLQGQDILEPSWDRTGLLWLVDRRGGRARIVAVDDRNQLLTVSAPGLVDKDVRGLKVSRDGARVAALVRNSGQTDLLIGRIERRGGLAIRGLRRLPVPMTSMSDLAWSDLDQVAVIGANGAGPPRPIRVSVDGSQVDQLSAGPDARAIAAAPGQPLILGGDDKHIHREDPNYLWSDRGEGTCPAYPG
ncbi:LpqB family beta-propeller domain-containing protein [Actinopolymorpha alba]|uniref:LpqB family beta-propeller domain-containing protein n=1 Tax=Actinopolymorpha alba TaxID=533267 RepID=UPI00035CF2C5|nr:LpqB family beta-propeller domain-containing protein [Actinopolymorpha alba]